jgi:hypothetical protein
MSKVKEIYKVKDIGYMKLTPQNSLLFIAIFLLFYWNLLAISQQFRENPEILP